MNNIPNIALVGNAPEEKHAVLNAMLSEEELGEVCTITLYGADGQPEAEALQDAIADWQDGEVQGIVCLPMQMSPKEIMTQYLEQEEAEKVVLVDVNDAITMAAVTDDAATLTTEVVKATIEKVAKALKRDMYILNPRLAVIATSNAEAEVAKNAADEVVKAGVQTFGPLSGATFFEGDEYRAFDAAVQMVGGTMNRVHRSATEYPTVTLASGIDMPIAFAEAEGALKAVFTVIDAARYRREYDRPFRNPLQKLYHERREDGDKARFAVKKKGFHPAEHRRENVTFITQKTEKKKPEA